MIRFTKVLCIVNLVTAVVVWMPTLGELKYNEGGLFAELDRIFMASFLICFLYALQGLLIFFKPLKKWDLVFSGAILLTAIFFSVFMELYEFLILAIPVGIYGALQFIRNKIPDNTKILYLNLWNILTVIPYLFDRFSSAI